MEIFIDADGCPVVNITIKIAEQYSIPVTIVCDTAHVFNNARANVVTVGKGNDSADFKLVNMVNAGDIVVTQDYGLAAMCLAKKAVPVSQNGQIYDNKNIDSMLFARYTAKKIRSSGGRLKGPKKRTHEQDKAFLKTLEYLILNKF